MLCKKCNADTGVKDTRYSRIEREFRFIIRTRQCENKKCEHRFKTIEVERDHYRNLIAQEDDFKTYNQLRDQFNSQEDNWQARFDLVEDTFNGHVDALTKQYKEEVAELKKTIKELKKKKQISFKPSKEKPKQLKDLYSYDDYDQEEDWEQTIDDIKRNTRFD